MNLNEKQLLAAIQAGGSQRQRAIAQVYSDRQLKMKVIRFVRNNNGIEQDGVDMFHEGIIVLDRNIRNGKFREEGTLKGYLYSTCKLLWMNQIRKNTRVSYTDDNFKLDETVHETPESLSLQKEQATVLRKVLATLGEKCQKVLELWKLSYSMEEIAQAVGLQNASIARKQKYRCYQSLLQKIEGNEQLKAFLKR